MCNMPDVGVQQMSNFGGKKRVGRPEITDKKEKVSIRLSSSLLTKIRSRGQVTSFIEACIASSANVQPGSYLRTNYDRSSRGNLEKNVTSVISDRFLCTSMKVSTIMSIFISDCDGTGLIVSGP